jgi:hypothetical protein
MSLCSARCILLTPSLHLRSYDDGVNRDGVCDDNDCGLVSDGECCDSELGFVGVKCVDNTSSCLAEQSYVDGANEAVFDSESRDDGGTVSGS